MLEPGTIVLGKIKILRLLGAGAMGKVYEVEHLATLHRRALKVIEPSASADPDAMERLQREASVAARAGDPRIVETLDTGILENGSVYLLMEKLEGEPLDAVLRGGRLPPAVAAFIVKEAARGLHAAHQSGIVHRDVKPANLFVTVRDGMPFVKVLDFGMSKLDPSHGGLAVTQSGTTLGTPLYMAPEQMRGARHVDARADVYALGVVLYECLAGVRPFDVDSFAELAALVMNGTVTPLGRDVPQGLRDLVQRAMQPQVERRLDSAKALADALEPFASAADAKQVLGGAVANAATLKRDSGGLESTLAPASRTTPRRTLIVASSLVAVLFAGWLLWPAAKPGPETREDEPSATVPPSSTIPPVVEQALSGDAGAERRPELVHEARESPLPNAVASKPTPRSAPGPALGLVTKASRGKAEKPDAGSDARSPVDPMDVMK